MGIDIKSAAAADWCTIRLFRYHRHVLGNQGGQREEEVQRGLNASYVLQLLDQWTEAREDQRPKRLGEEPSVDYREEIISEGNLPLMLHFPPDRSHLGYFRIGRSNRLYPTVLGLVEKSSPQTSDDDKHQMAHEVIARGIFEAENRWRWQFSVSKWIQRGITTVSVFAAAAVGVALTPGNLFVAAGIGALGTSAWWLENARRKAVARASSAPDFRSFGLPSQDVEMLSKEVSSEISMAKIESWFFAGITAVVVAIGAFWTGSQMGDTTIGPPRPPHPSSPRSTSTSGSAENVWTRLDASQEPSASLSVKAVGPKPTDIPLMPTSDDWQGKPGLGVGI